jgi:hypothetical protein
MTKAELLEALLIERYGYLHPEYRPTARDAEAAGGRQDLDQDAADSPAAALRLIADNTTDLTVYDTPTHLTGTEHK